MSKSKTTTNKRREKNGVKEPVKGSIASKLWAICDDLKAKLNRPPARFEYREVATKSKENFNYESISYQYFQWRKFNGIKGHLTKRYPSRGTFQASKHTEAREASKKPKVKKATKKAAKKAVKKKVAPIKKATPAIISRAEAKKVKKKTYFTGKPCKNGHIAERTTGKGACVKCK